MKYDIHTHATTYRPDTQAVTDISGQIQNKNTYQIQKYTAGIHPKNISSDWENQLAQIERQNSDPKFYAIGECGLDKNSKTPKEQQEKIFEAQVILARRLNKPIIIHCVKQYTDIIRIIHKTKYTLPAIFHAYNGNPETTAQLLRLPNTYFSFSQKTFATPETSGARSLPAIPAERILTETDNDPGQDITATIRQIAARKKTTPSQIEKTIEQNFHRLGIQTENRHTTHKKSEPST